MNAEADARGGTVAMIERAVAALGDGALAAGGPSGGPRDYRYDPRHPIPTLGGRNMLIDAGPRDQRPAQALPDYGLVYRGEPLTEDLTIAGNVRVTLHVQSDCPDTDFVAKLIELLPDGRAMLLMDGIVRASLGGSDLLAQTRVGHRFRGDKARRSLKSCGLRTGAD